MSDNMVLFVIEILESIAVTRFIKNMGVLTVLKLNLLLFFSPFPGLIMNSEIFKGAHS